MICLAPPNLRAAAVVPYAGSRATAAVSQGPLSISMYFLPPPKSLIINIIIRNNGLSDQITLESLAFTRSRSMLKVFCWFKLKAGHVSLLKKYSFPASKRWEISLYLTMFSVCQMQNKGGFIVAFLAQVIM